MSIRGYVLAVSAILFLATASVAARAAECPVRVSALDLEGKGMADHVFRYRVVLSAYSGDVSPDAGLQINLASRNPPIRMRASHLQLKRGAAAYNDVVIFRRPSQDVTSVAVVDTGADGSITPCSSSSVHVGDKVTDLTGWEIPTVLVSFDDSRGVSSDASWADVLPGRSFDSRFKTRSAVDYPPRAMDTSISGQVRVGIRIGSAGEIGMPHIVNSSGSKLLDDAAIAAATSSTYSGTVVDGIPVANEYFIIYEFSLDRIPSDPMSGERISYCPATLDGITLATGLFGGSAYWYAVQVRTIRSHVDSLSLAVVGIQSPRSLLHWGPPLGERDLSTDEKQTQHDEFSVSGALFWPGDALAAGGIQDVTPRTKKAVTCEPNPVPVRNVLDDNTLVAVAETDRPWLTSPILESILPARFATVVWPKYNTSSGDPNTAVAIGVSVHVTQSGQPLVAHVNGATFAPGFAAAALAAAMASTYVVPRTSDGAPLTQTFETTYVYDPAL